MEAIETPRCMNTQWISEDWDKMQLLRSLFVSALSGERNYHGYVCSIDSWENLYSFIISNTDFMQSVKDEAELKYFASRSLRNVHGILENPASNISPSVVSRLRTIFDDLCKAMSCVFSDCSAIPNVMFDNQSILKSVLAPWHSDADSSYLPSKMQNKSAEEKVENFRRDSDGLLMQEDNRLVDCTHYAVITLQDKILRDELPVNLEYGGNDEFVKLILSIKSKSSLKELGMLGKYDFIYFIREGIRSWNFSPYAVKPVIKPKNNEAHYIFSTFGILAITEKEQEHLSLTEWFTEAVLYDSLIQISSFRYHPTWKSFLTWRQNTRRRKFKRVYKVLSKICLIANPVYVRLLQVIQQLFQSLDTLRFFPNMTCNPMNIVQFCAEINRNIRYNVILMSHVTKCIFTTCKYARYVLAKLIRCREDELNWNSKEINQTLPMSETWKKGVKIRNELEMLCNHMENFPNLINCIRYQLISFVLNKFQSSIQNYVHVKVNMNNNESKNNEFMNKINEETTRNNYRLVIHPVLFKISQVISDKELPQIYFSEKDEAEKINEYNQNQLYANSLVQNFYKNSHLIDPTPQKHETTIPWDIINPVGLEETNIYIREMVNQYVPTYEKFEKDLLPKCVPYVNELSSFNWHSSHSHLNISGQNFFPSFDNAAQFQILPILEQQSESMQLYETLMMPWSQTIHEKTRQVIQSLQWIKDVDLTINELRRLIQVSVDWINNIQSTFRYGSLFNDNVETNANHFFILIDYDPLLTLLYHEITGMLNQLFTPFIAVVCSSLVSMNNQLDDLIQTHTNFQPDFDGFMQVVTYLERIRISHDDIFKNHGILCHQVEFLQYFQKCLVNCNELKEIKLINWSYYEQFIVKWKKFTNLIEWARKKFLRNREDFYQCYNKKIKEYLDEAKNLVHLITTGKYSDIKGDPTSILNDMKEPYSHLIKLETSVHQLVRQYRTVRNCEQYEKELEKGNAIEKINLSLSLPKVMNTTRLGKVHIGEDKTNFTKMKVLNKYLNENNEDLMLMDSEMKKVNCRYAAWQLNKKLKEYEQELYKSTVGEICLKTTNEKHEKLVLICNSLSNNDIVVQFNSKWLKRIKKILGILKYISDTELLHSSSDYWNKCSSLLNISLSVKWENCPIGDLMKNPDINLLKRKQNLEEIWRVFQYLKSIRELYITLESQWLSLNVHFISINSYPNMMKAVHSLLHDKYIEQLNQTISEKSLSDSNHLEFDMQLPWIFLNMSSLTEQLYNISVKIENILQSGHLELIKPIKVKSLSSSSLVNDDCTKAARYSLKKINRIIRILSDIKSIQVHWLYLYRFYSFKQPNKEISSSQFIHLTNKFVQLENDFLSSDQIVVNQPIVYSEREDVRQFQRKSINLQLFISLINPKWNLWSTIKSELQEGVKMFSQSIDDMCDNSLKRIVAQVNFSISGISIICLLSNTERMELLANWYIPYHDYAAPFKCSIKDIVNNEDNLYQFHFNNLPDGGLIDLIKWISRLFPFLINCNMVWCKKENCWKITEVINEFNQNIRLFESIKWMPSVGQWFSQFYSILQLTLIRLTLDSTLKLNESGHCISDLIGIKQNVPIVILELAKRIISWRRLEEVVTQESGTNELDSVSEYFQQKMDSLGTLLNSSYGCNQKLFSRIEHLTYQILSGTILGFIHLTQNLKKESILDQNNFTWLQLIKTQIISSECNHEAHCDISKEFTQYDGIPAIGINQFSTIHLYKWDNQSLLLNNNTSFVPPLNTSQELIKLASALTNHEFGLLVGPTGYGKQTIIRQLAFILGRRLVEFSCIPNAITFEVFEKMLKFDLLKCARIGCLFSFMNIQNLEFGKLDILIKCLNEIQKCNLLKTEIPQSHHFTGNLQYTLQNLDKNGHQFIVSQLNKWKPYPEQCLFNQKVKIDSSFGNYGTFDLHTFQNISEMQKIEEKYKVKRNWFSIEAGNKVSIQH
ncbi:unnamed protein product [Heterobilharzia americana]|nr:unnamed protein product [Heterobilharzia americana]